MAGIVTRPYAPGMSQKDILGGIASSHPEAVKPYTPEPAIASVQAPQQPPSDGLPMYMDAPQRDLTAAPEPAPTATAAPAPAPAPTSPTQALSMMASGPVDAGAGWAQVSTPGQTRPGLGQRLPFVPARASGVRY